MPKRAMTSLPVWVPRFSDRGQSLDRVSGLPLGLPVEQWPACGICGVPLAFIGQLAHSPPRIDLGAEGRVLYAFLCKNLESQNDCGRSAGVPRNTDGAHAVVLVDDVQATRTPAPAGLLEYEPALVVTDWTAADEVVPNQLLEHLLYGLCQERRTWPMELADIHGLARTQGTKIGGVPLWIQDPIFNDMLEDSHSYRYIAQWGDAEEVDGTSFWTTLEVGRLYLLEHRGDDGPSFELYYVAR